MSLDLEERLKKLCNQNQPKLDLYERLLRVRSSAETIWQEQRLKWFTDHRATTHSHYIIKHLDSVLEHLWNTPQHLNAHELYVLLASCYLHDIGMQDFQSDDGRGVEQFNEEDYERIRKIHPERSKKLIIERTLWRGRSEFHIDLDDDPQYLVPLALVSQGHGSDYFINTVEELRKLPHRPGNMPFRGGLLTALLLMGDELDLHERRSTFLPEFALSPVSLLHHYIHHYVTRVDVINGRTPKYRRISLTLEFPKDSDEYRSDVRNWITTKLRKQIELTNPLIEQFTQGELRWDDQVEVKETIDKYGVRRSLSESKPALHELKHNVISSQTLNRMKLIEIFRNSIKRRIEKFQVLKVIDGEDSDWSHIVKYLKVLCKCKSGVFIHVGFHQSVGHDSLDVLHRLANELTKAGLTCSAYHIEKESVSEVQPDPLGMLGKALITDIQNWADSPPLVLLLERVDKAESDTVRWMKEWFLPELSKQDVKLIVIFTQFERGGIEATFNHVCVFRLEPFTKGQIKEYLQTGFGFSPDRAENEACYLFSLSSGIPANIYRGFSTRRAQGVKTMESLI